MPLDCLILGCGRSGTSMLAGTLAQADYFLGDDLIPPSPANPKGFFEDREINSINEALLAQVTPARPPGAPLSLMPPEEQVLWGPHTLWGWRWLVRLPVGTSIPCPPPLADRIRRQIERRPFCFKDPRFCYTLPAWLPLLTERVVVLCIFREPARSARSIVKECVDGVYLHGYQLDYAEALDLWCTSYEHLLQFAASAAGGRDGRATWLFLHFDQILTGTATPSLEAHLDVTLPERFAERRLQRSSAEGPGDARADAICAQLCERADFAPRAAAARYSAPPSVPMVRMTEPK